MTETKDKINIIRAKYTASAVKKAQYPAERLKEIAFIGRSNVGKSSLINSLTRVHNLARVSGQPGKTQTMSTAIYAAVQANDQESAFLWAVIIIIFSLLVMMFMNYWLKKQKSMIE